MGIIESGFIDAGPVESQEMTLRLLFEVADGWVATGNPNQISNDNVTAGSAKTCGQISNDGYDGGGDAVPFDGIAFSTREHMAILPITNTAGPVIETLSTKSELRFITETYQVTDTLSDLLLLNHSIITTSDFAFIKDRGSNLASSFFTKSYGYGTSEFSGIYGVLIRYYDIQNDARDFDIVTSFAFFNGFPRRYTN